MKTKNKSVLQLVFGWGIILFLIIMAIQYMTADYYDDMPDASSRAKMIVSMVAGLAFGYILVRGRFSFAAPIKRMVVNGDGSQARAFILMLSISTVIGGALITGLTPQGIGGHALYVGAGFGSMIGGLIFGLGMMFSGSCASGALTDLGQGVISAIYVLLFFIVGSVAGQALADKVATVDNWTFIHAGNQNDQIISDAYYGDLFGSTESVWAAVAINLVIFGGFGILTKLIEKFRIKKNTFEVVKFDEKYPFTPEEDEAMRHKIFSRKLYYIMFEKRWTWWVGAILLGGLFAMWLIGWREPPVVTPAYTKLGGWTLWAFGWHDVYTWKVNGIAVVGDISYGPLKDPGTLLNIFIVLGAMFYVLTSKQFQFKNFKKWSWKDWIFYALGGLLMGVGSRLANGCNIGAEWSSLSLFTANGWFFTIPTVIGGVAGIYILKSSKALVGGKRSNKDATDHS